MSDPDLGVKAHREDAVEQAALRHIATLVAEGVEPDELFAAVAEAVSRVVGARFVVVARYEPDGSASVRGTFPSDTPLFATGARISLEGVSVMAWIRRRGESARIDDYGPLEGEIARVARANNVKCGVGVPVLVAGRVWGSIVAWSAERLPDNFEGDLAEFTSLLAVVIANAESTRALEELADEQVALRHVATLIAKGDRPEEVFARVAEETARVFRAAESTLLRQDPDGCATNVGCWGDQIAVVFPLGSRFVPDGDGLAATVLRTGRSHRIDDYSKVTDPVARSARDRGIESSIGAPIMVRGAVWGAIVVNSAAPFPLGTELRLTDFAELVATAILNAESRGALAALASEQAALRRVATLVAQGVPSKVLLNAVCEEVEALSGADAAVVVRFEPDDTVTIMGSHATRQPVGARIALDPEFVIAEVRTTGRAARFDTDEPGADEQPRVVRAEHVRSAVASPIVVEGKLWGAIAAATRERLLASGEERRLAEFTELVATAIANSASKSELAASRRRIVAAADETRRQIERDLHDGTQQRLLSIALEVRAAEAGLPPERRELRSQLAGVEEGLLGALQDLQEISRGIHPAILSRGGLAPALRALGHRSAIPVDLDVRTEVRLPEPIEVAAYFVVSEALANAAKHSGASGIEISLEQRGDRVLLVVRDDGVGGADASGGSGLVGLIDRVEALGGSLDVSSRPGNGTQIAVELPAV